jgi:type II secretory pathway component PulF
MALVWRYRGTDADQRPMRGVMVAASRDLAWGRLAAGGVQPARVRLDPVLTLARALAAGPDARDLERLYRSLGQRLAHATPAPRALAGC